MTIVCKSESEYREWVDKVEAQRFLDYQIKWVRDRSRNKIAEKSRQIGFSWCDAYDTVTETGLVDWPYDCWISSRDQIQAQLYGADAQFWGGILDMAAGDVGETLLEAENGTKVSAWRLPFANGRCAWFLSSNADAQAGKRGTRKHDEFALNKENRKLYAIGTPGTTWGGRNVIFSTHRGTANYFNELIVEARFKGNPKKFSLHRVTLEDALRDGLLIKLKQRWRSMNPEDDRLALDEDAYLQMVRDGCTDEETFQQEYMCKPDDDASAFITYEMIDGCKYAPGEKWEMTLAELARVTNPLYLGVDVGRRKDLTSIWIDEHVGGLELCRYQLDLARMPFSQQEAIVYPLLELPMLRRACFDATGLGMQFAERAQQRFGEYKVEAITFTGPVKEELAYPVRAALEDRSCRIPDRPAVIADFRGIRKETTTSGNIRFSGERSETGHCDRFWAKALAKHAGKTFTGDFHFESAKLRRGDMAAARIDRRVLTS